MFLASKDLGTLSMQSNRATLRSDPTQAVRYYGGGQRQRVAVFL